MFLQTAAATSKGLLQPSLGGWCEQLSPILATPLAPKPVPLLDQRHLTNIDCPAADHRSDVKGLLLPTLGGWCEQLSRILATPLAPETQAGWGAQMEALKVLTLLAAHFGEAVAPHMAGGLAGHVWQLFSGEVRVTGACDCTLSRILES